MKKYREALNENKTIETTIDLAALVRGTAWPRRAQIAVKKMKRQVKLMFKTDENIALTTELNNFIFSKGVKRIPRKVRVQVERSTDNKNAEQSILKLSFIPVGNFKKLKTEIVGE